MWPKPMPNRWILGSAAGVAVDARDHIFVLNLIRTASTRAPRSGSGTNPTTGECCTPAPAVLEYDATGKLVGHWGGAGRGYDWPATPTRASRSTTQATCGSAARGGSDTRISKFAHDGKFIAAVRQSRCAVCDGARRRRGAGHRVRGRVAAALRRRGAAEVAVDAAGAVDAPRDSPPNSSSMDSFGGATSISFDASANEAFVADGSRNHRVAVIDMTTGAIKRVWGAYGNKPDDAEARAVFAERARRRSSSAPCACAKIAQGRHGLRLRPHERPHSGLQEGRIVREGEKRRAEDARRRLGVGHRVLARPAAEVPLRRRRHEHEGLQCSTARRSTELSTFGDGGRQPGSSTPCTASRPTRRATSTRPKRTRASACRSSTTRELAPVTTTNAGVRVAGEARERQAMTTSTI